jgi:alpha-methylacyl-CoA racemase
MFAVLGILAALYAREQTGRGDVLDVAMIDGASSLMTMFWTLAEHSLWAPERGTNVIDGGAPFYDTYECSDGRYVAVGAVEPQFYAQLVHGLGLGSEPLPAQYDQSGWPVLRERFSEVFHSRSRDEWADVFAGRDACVTPVLALEEVPRDPHIAARETIVEAFGRRQPAAAPRFADAAPPQYVAPRATGADTAAVFADWGIAED